MHYINYNIRTEENFDSLVLQGQLKHLNIQTAFAKLLYDALLKKYLIKE